MPLGEDRDFFVLLGLYEWATQHRRDWFTRNGARLWQRSPHVSLVFSQFFFLL
jgi:hypothetical protein